MKSRMKTILLMLLVVLLLGGLISSASGSSQIYLMSVNDTVVEMTPENMPIISDNQIYIPYTMLSSQVTGISLGVRAQYTVSRGTLTVTDGAKTATFDVRNNTAYTSLGETLNVRAVVRNAMVFLPVSWLCGYFTSIRCTVNYTGYGMLIRLTNSAAVLTDAEFIDAASTLLEQNLRRYRNALTSDPAVTPPPSPPATPTVPPVHTPDPEPVPLVYLAFRWGDRADEVADLLESSGQRALFLFEDKELMQQDDLVRRLIGRGHQVGLALSGNEIDSCLEQLGSGRRAMNDIARSRICIVSADGLAERDRQALEEWGCAVWKAGLKADDMDAGDLTREFKLEEPSYVELSCDRNGLALLAELLLGVDRAEFRLGLPVATAV